MAKQTWLRTGYVMLSVIMLGLLVGACTMPASTTTSTPSTTTAAPIELRFASQAPVGSGWNVLDLAWIKEVEERSDGRIKINYFPAQQLGPIAQYPDLVAGGSIDIANVAQGQTPGRYPLSEVAALPFIIPNAMAGSRAYQELYETDKDVQAEWNALHVIGLSVTATRQLFTTKPVRMLSDLSGLTIATMDGVAAASIKAMGGAAVTMPVGDVTTSLERGVIEGIVFEWDPIVAWKIVEVVKYATLLDVNSSIVSLVMNKEKYNSLPADLKEVIDSVSGDWRAQLAASEMGKVNDVAKDKVVAAGIELISLPASEMDKLKPIASSQMADWAASMEAKEKPGDRVVAEWIDLVNKYR